MARVQSRVQHVGRVRPFAQRDLDRVLLVRLATAVIPLIQLKRNVGLKRVNDMPQGLAKSTHSVVELRYPPIRDRQPREEYQVHEGVNVALLREV